jgi:hypothetical protein
LFSSKIEPLFFFLRRLFPPTHGAATPAKKSERWSDVGVLEL